MSLKPTFVESIYITASKEGYIIGKNIIEPIGDKTPPELIVNVDEIPKLTNKSTITVSGKASDENGVVVIVNGVETTPDSEGNFSCEVKFEKEGKNIIIVIAKDTYGNITKKEIEIVVDLTPPEIIMVEGKYVYYPEEEMKGVIQFIVDEDFRAGTIKFGEKEFQGFKVGSDNLIFEVVFPNHGLLEATVNIEDIAGNGTSKLFYIPVYIHHILELGVDSKNVRIDGKWISYEVAPYIKDGRTMVPLRLIAEAFGAEVQLGSSNSRYYDNFRRYKYWSSNREPNCYG